MQNDLTTGSVFRNVVSFSLPYLLSYFLQTLYGMADLFIIGQFEGVASTTAVSIGSHNPELLNLLEEAHWRVLRAETSCNFFWGDAWVMRCHADLDQACECLERANACFA